jgi:hypothetical protein
MQSRHHWQPGVTARGPNPREAQDGFSKDYAKRFLGFREDKGALSPALDRCVEEESPKASTNCRSDENQNSSRSWELAVSLHQRCEKWRRFLEGRANRSVACY